MLSLSGCSDESSVLAPPGVPPIPRHQLLAAPDSLTMGGYRIQVTPRLYRDFMPPSPPNGRPLSAGFILQVAGLDSFPPIPMVEAFVWVFNGPEVWAAQAQIWGAGALFIQARDGPLWGPDILVDTVLGIRDNHRTLHLVLCRDVPIMMSQ
jgi:hypothetical protein